MRPRITSFKPDEKCTTLLETIEGTPASNAQIEITPARDFATLPFKRPPSTSFFGTAHAPPANKVLDRAAQFNPIVCSCAIGTTENYIRLKKILSQKEHYVVVRYYRS